MTDTPVAPAGGAPDAASNEVPINPNPVNVPNPVGAQAPDRTDIEPEGSPHRPQSRREAIKAAFDRATKQQDEGTQRPPKRQETPKETPKAAEAKPGHNKPPEETKPERPQQHREQGRFARAPDAQQQPRQQQPPQQQPANPLPDHAPYRDPLPRFRDQAKAEWASAPESVRGEVYRMAHEFAQGFKRYKDDFEAMKPIRRFHEMAQSHGTTLEKALTNYVSMEQKLRQDPIAGLDIIINNLGLTTPDGQRLGLRDIAYHVLSQTPDQLRSLQQGNMQAAAAQQIGALHAKVGELQNALQQMHTRQQFTYTRSAVDQFADSHPRFDELGDLIEQELKLGFDLETAYRRAELLRPATQAAQTRTSPSAQTRQADRSIHGAPSGGPSNGSAERKGPPPSRRDAIQRAIQRVNGGI